MNSLLEVGKGNSDKVRIVIQNSQDEMTKHVVFIAITLFIQVLISESVRVQMNKLAEGRQQFSVAPGLECGL